MATGPHDMRSDDKKRGTHDRLNIAGIKNYGADCAFNVATQFLLALTFGLPSVTSPWGCNLISDALRYTGWLTATFLCLVVNPLTRALRKEFGVFRGSRVQHDVGDVFLKALEGSGHRDSFEFFLKENRTCINGHTWESEPVSHLTLITPTESCNSLEEALANNAFRGHTETMCCPQCRKDVAVTSHPTMSGTPPDILVVELTYGHSDAAPTIEIPQNLNVGSTTEYELVSITQHNGSSIAGHYVAYKRSTELGCWIMFNDEKVFRMPANFNPGMLQGVRLLGYKVWWINVFFIIINYFN